MLGSVGPCLAQNKKGVDAANAKSLALVGKPAPDFSLPDFQRQSFQLASRRGSVVVLAFWASYEARWKRRGAEYPYFKPPCVRNSAATSATLRCSRSTSALILRIISVVNLPESSVRNPRNPGSAVSTS